MVTMTAVNTMNTGSLWLWGGIISLAMIGLLFTSYRYAVGYFLVGMTYWLGIEAISWAVMAVTPLESFHAYILAVALSMLPLMGLLTLKDKGIDITRVDYQVVWMWLINKARKGVKPSSESTMILPPRIAGHKPFILEQDTDFSQHCVRHTPVFHYEN